MTQSSFPWLSVEGDRTVTAAMQKQVNLDYGFQGVIGGLAPTKSGSDAVSVAAGSATLQGVTYVNDGAVVITPSAGSRKDYVVLRYTAADRAIVLANLEGTSENFPTLTQTSAVYEVAIASVDDSTGAFTVADTRSNPKVCGMYAADVLPAGAVQPFAFATAPTGWLQCNGAAVSRTTYARLFAAIGTTFGAGDGSDTFNLPNLKGRVPVGIDATQTEFDALGEAGGAKTHTLTTAELASHTHLIDMRTGSNALSHTQGSSPYTPAAGGTGTLLEDYAATDANGSGTAHNNLQPYLTLNYCIKY